MTTLALKTIDALKTSLLARSGGPYYHFLGSVVRFGLLVALAVHLTGRADGSCGDYLEHGPVVSFSLRTANEITADSVPVQVPSGQCRHGNCRGQAPANVPLNDKNELRRDDRCSAMSIALNRILLNGFSHSGLMVDENLPPQVFLEVDVPPPRSWH